MLTNTLITLFSRDLSRLMQQIDAYDDERLLWEIAPGITNAPGNLCLHLIGNLNAYVGATLGHTGYVRDRPAEFSVKHIPRAVLMADLASTKAMISTTLSAMPDEQFSNPYPIEVLGYPMTVHYFLVHLSGHLNYHLGQIDYHRRLLTGGKRVTYQE